MTAAVAADRTWLVGEQLPPLVIDRVDRTTLALFAGGSGDHNPIHLDLDVARTAGMDDVFAPGMLSMAFLGRLLTNNFPQSQLRSFQTRFTAITPVNGALLCFAEVACVESDLLTLDLRVELDSRTTTLAGTATLSLNVSERC